MEKSGARACFRLGEPFPGHGEQPCEPHISVFMMAVEHHEITEVASALRATAATLSPVSAIGVEYRHNHEGAPELFYARSEAFRALQRGVVAAVEPLRRGRLRECGPGGETLAEIAAQRDPQDPARVRQLKRYGFDDISDERDDRFNPHLTLCWPHTPTPRVELSGLPQANQFSGLLAEVGLFGMTPNGTCTGRYAVVAVGGSPPAATSSAGC
jgi:hypothetical protein